MPAFNNSKVQIIFNEVPGIDEVINLTESSLGLNLNTTFKQTRTGAGETKRPTYVDTTESWIGSISTNYRTSFIADYVTILQSGNLNFTLFDQSDSFGGTGKIIIFANFENAVFATSSNTTTADIIITNKVPPTIPTAVGGNVINLIWDGAVDDIGIIGYQIQWKFATTPSAPWSSIISVTHDPTYGLNTIKSGGGFYNHTTTQLVDHIFRIRAIDSIGQFSGYKEITVSVDSNTILISPISTTSQSLSCSAHPLVPTNPVLLTTPTIQLGITFVKNTDNSVFIGEDKYWRILLLGISYGCKIDYDGKIMEFSQCSLGGTGTIQSEFMSSYGYPAASTTGSDICSGSTNLSVYYYSPLAAGSVVYSTLEDDNSLSFPVTTVNNKYYIITDVVNTHIAKFKTNGIVDSIVGSFESICPTAPPPNPCCFVKGTKISMFDNTSKNIEDVKIGDIVITYNEETKLQEPGEVSHTMSPLRSDIVEYKLSNDVIVKSTTCHPYWVVNKGWSSFNPELTKNLYDFDVERILENDILLSVDNDEVIIYSITELITKEVFTYNLGIIGNHTYYANGILVHNKTDPNNPNAYQTACVTQVP